MLRGSYFVSSRYFIVTFPVSFNIRFVLLFCIYVVTQSDLEQKNRRIRTKTFYFSNVSFSFFLRKDYKDRIRKILSKYTRASLDLNLFDLDRIWNFRKTYTFVVLGFSIVFSVVRCALFRRREHSNSLFQGRPEGETVSGETGFGSTVRFVSTFRERRQFVSSRGRPKKETVSGQT